MFVMTPVQQIQRYALVGVSHCGLGTIARRC